MKELTKLEYIATHLLSGLLSDPENIVARRKWGKNDNLEECAVYRAKELIALCKQVEAENNE